MERSCTDIHHGIKDLAALRTIASRSGDPSERGCPTGRLRRRKPVPFVISSAGGGQRASRFQDTVGKCFLAWNTSVSGPRPLSTGRRRPFTGNRDLPAAGRSWGNCQLAGGSTHSCAEPIRHSQPSSYLMLHCCHLVPIPPFRGSHSSKLKNFLTLPS